MELALVLQWMLYSAVVYLLLGHLLEEAGRGFGNHASRPVEIRLNPRSHVFVGLTSRCEQVYVDFVSPLLFRRRFTRLYS